MKIRILSCPSPPPIPGEPIIFHSLLFEGLSGGSGTYTHTLTQTHMDTFTHMLHTYTHTHTLIHTHTHTYTHTLIHTHTHTHTHTQFLPPPWLPSAARHQLKPPTTHLPNSGQKACTDIFSTFQHEHAKWWSAPLQQQRTPEVHQGAGAGGSYANVSAISGFVIKGNGVTEIRAPKISLELSPGCLMWSFVNLKVPFSLCKTKGVP